MGRTGKGEWEREGVLPWEKGGGKRKSLSSVHRVISNCFVIDINVKKKKKILMKF